MLPALQMWAACGCSHVVGPLAPPNKADGWLPVCQGEMGDVQHLFARNRDQSPLSPHPLQVRLRNETLFCFLLRMAKQ